MTRPCRTKILATLGPASWDEGVLTQLLEAGVDVCRINCSHADHAGIVTQVSRVRRASARLGRPTAILLDLQGPKVRTGKVPTPLKLARGDLLTIVMDEHLVGEGHRVGTTYPQMSDDAPVGARVLFADGALAGVIEAIHLDRTPAEVDIRMDVGGDLGSHKGINRPGVAMSIPCLTDKDIADLHVGLDNGVDYVALSFVRHPDDVIRLQEVMAAHGRVVPIVSKIEKPQAMDHLDAILDVSDGVMVARGDLGVEVQLERVPVYQKTIIAAAHRKGRLCITATQMLDSMERNPRPTRAETTDVANAILDGTDAGRLSGETATGAWPVEAVATMARIAADVEASAFFKPIPPDRLPPMPGATGVVVRAATGAAHEAGRPLVVFTWSGSTARMASKARPRGPIFALTPNPQVADRLALVWGVTPIVAPNVEGTDELIAVGERVLLQRGDVTAGVELVILAGSAPREGATNLLKIHVVGR